MSPIERRRILGRIPVEKWKPTKPGDVLYEHDASPFSTQPYKIRKLQVIDNNTVELSFDLLILSHDQAEGQIHSLFHSERISISREEINGSSRRPFKTGKPLFRQQLRWKP